MMQKCVANCDTATHYATVSARRSCVLRPTGTDDVTPNDPRVLLCTVPDPSCSESRKRRPGIRQAISPARCRYREHNVVYILHPVIGVWHKKPSHKESHDHGCQRYLPIRGGKPIPIYRARLVEAW